MYQPAIDLYLESVQLAPASTAHHHAGLGGLATHTFDVVDRALRQRQSVSLPLNAGPDVIDRQKHLWTYAIFIGALIHDIGKMMTNTVIVFNNGKSWNPHYSEILKSGAKSYHIEFNKLPYSYHTRVAASFFHTIPSEGRGWLAQNPEILTELCAWLYGDVYEFGMIGKVVRYADGQSVAANLKIGGERNRFSNAPEIPLIEKLMTAIRALIDSKEIKINGTTGSSGWNVGAFTYLVCGTVADKVRTHLLKSGATDIPSDNARLFDIWQEHGYAISNPEGGAIWRIKIDRKLKLTVLKFESNRIFHPSKRPGEFDGSIAIVADSRNTEESAPEQVPEVPVIEQVPTKQAELESLPDHTSDEEANDDDMIPEPEDLPQESMTTSTETEEIDHVNNIDTVAEQEEPIQITENNDPGKTDQIYKKASQLPASLNIKDPKIANYYLTWLKEGLAERKFQVNNKEAFIHVVKEGVVLVTPLAFKKFIWAFELCPEGENINKQITRLQGCLRKVLEGKQQHRQTAIGSNVHVYKINGDRVTSKINCWLLPSKVAFGNTKPPSINGVLENISGFKQ